MKKLLNCLFIICCLFILNVKADFCKYNINGNDYTLYYEVNYNSINWTSAFSFGGGKKSIQLVYTNGSSDGSGLTVERATENKLFAKFFSFGSTNQTGACPVLVSIGLNKYTVMPFDVYNEFFALSNTLYCEGCNDDLINAKSYTGSERKYTFEDVCNYINENRTKNYHHTYVKRPEYVPLLGYFYFNPNYSSGSVYYNNRIISSSGITQVCKDYKKSKSGLPDGVTLRQMLSRYEKDFIIGEVDGVADAQNICPLNDGKNKLSDIMSCLNEKGNTIDKSIEKFKKVCTENEMRAIQSYASGTTATFYDKGNVSSYLDNEIKMLFNSFSSECGEAADELYSNINNLNRILYSYSNHDEITSKLSYMYVQSKYLIGYSLLTNANANVKIVEDGCQLISSGLRNIIKEVLNALRIGAVVIVIFLSIVEIYKAVIAGDDSARKKMPSLISKRLIYLAIVLLLPALVMIFLDLLNKYFPVDTSKCVISDLKE